MKCKVMMRSLLDTFCIIINKPVQQWISLSSKSPKSSNSHAHNEQYTLLW